MQDRLVLGDSLNFSTVVTGYSAADGWTLHYVLNPLVSGVGVAVNITAAQDPDNLDAHLVQVIAATTDTWTAGEYSWASRVEKAAERYSVSSGVTTLIANPFTAAGAYDSRTDAQRALADAKAALAAWTPTVKRYAIAGREQEFNSIGEILKAVSYWENQVKAEENLAAMQAGQKSSRKIMVRSLRG